MDWRLGVISKSPIAIVGNGAAAVQAILSLRECRYDGSIHLFCDSPHAAYNPMLTPYYAGGTISLDQCFLFGSGLEFYRRNGVDLSLGSPVVELDAEGQTLRTAAGDKLRYERCLVATGASPILPEILDTS